MTSNHYIFVDYENVQNVDLSLVSGKSVRVILVLGKNQSSLPVELVKQMLDPVVQARIVETETTGKNALDFVLAWEAGLLSAADPKGCYHIVSKDKGFDALIAHLRKCGLKGSRHESFAKIPVLAAVQPTPAVTGLKVVAKKPTPTSLGDRAAAIREWLPRCQANRPKREKTLLSTIHAHFGKDLTEQEVRAVVDQLVKQQVVAICTEGKVTYSI